MGGNKGTRERAHRNVVAIPKQRGPSNVVARLHKMQIDWPTIIMVIKRVGCHADLMLATRTSPRGNVRNTNDSLWILGRVVVRNAK
jgi:hypothetical protein